MKLIPYTLASCHEHVRVIRNIIVDPPVSIPNVSKQVSSEKKTTKKKPEDKQQQQQKPQEQQQQQQEQKKEDVTTKDNKKPEEETKEEDKKLVTNPKSQTHKLIQDAVRTRESVE